MFVSSLWIFVPILQHRTRIVNSKLSGTAAESVASASLFYDRIVLIFLCFVESCRILASDCFRFFLQKGALHAMLYLSLGGNGAAALWGENM
jgi:hypothetical protein